MWIFKKLCIFAASSLVTIGGKSARMLHYGYFLYPYAIYGAQPRVIVVMAMAAYGNRLDNGKWAPFFVHMSKNYQYV
jgi:hypothetical protein